MSKDPKILRPPSRGGGPRPLPSPKHIATIPLPIRSWSAPLYRVCKVHRDPLYYGKDADNRFDDPRQEYGVMYTADTPEGAFLEVCVRERPTGNLVVLSYFEKRKLTEVSLSSPLRLVDVTGPGLSLLGLDNRLTTTGSYRVAQRWSRALWNHADCPDGILYCSRFNPSLRSIALFDRAGTGLSPRDCGPLADPRNLKFLTEMLDRYGLTL